METKRPLARPGGLLEWVALAVAVITVSGCTSFGMGEDEYSCSGLPEGTRCMSAREVYNSSNDGKAPGSTSSNSGDEVHEYQGASSANNEVYADFVAPRLPNQPIPVRTPAKVMRIWVAPWEDTNGDLIVSGHIYTEIESRKWVLGDKLGSSETPSLFQPLQVTKPSQ